MPEKPTDSPEEQRRRLRRTFLKLGIYSIPIITTGIACSKDFAGRPPMKGSPTDVTGEKKELFKEKRLVMGTSAEVAVYDTDKERAARAVDEALTETASHYMSVVYQIWRSRRGTPGLLPAPWPFPPSRPRR